MTETFPITRCAEMLKTVKLCAQALTSNADGDDVVAVEGVKMTLVKAGAIQGNAETTGKSGVVEFATRVSSQDIRSFFSKG